MSAENKTHPKLDELIAVAHKLRGPGGCPWDAEQTHNSLTKYLLEETYELIDAIESGNRDEIIEELYLRALGRPPTDAETTKLQTFFTDGKKPDVVLNDLFWALLNAKEFVFNH